MSQIRSKQIKLDALGDIIVGNTTISGSVLTKGLDRSVLIAGGTTLAYEFISELRDSLGNVLIQGIDSPGAVNIINVTGGTTGNGVELAAVGTDTNINILLSPLGTGDVIVPSTYVPDGVFSLVHKGYVDSVATGLDFKNSVKLATTSSTDLTGFTYTATTDEWTVVVTPTFDSIVLINGDRVLIKDAVDPRGNGIWDYDSSLSKFIRSIDADNSLQNEVSGGMFTFVETGTVNSDTGWVLSSPVGLALLGTDNLLFTQFSSAGIVSVTGGNGIISTQAGTVYTVKADVDNATIRNAGGSGSQVAVFNGLINQVLIGQGSGSDATWGYSSSLYDANGILIINGSSSTTPVNHINIINSDTTSGPIISSSGSDINVDLLIETQGSGRISLDGTLWPSSPIPQGSILGTNLANDLQPITAALSGIGDQLLIFNDTTNLLEWVASSTIGGNDWGDITLTGNTIGDLIVSPNSTNTTLTLNGGAGITLTGTNLTDTVAIDLSINSLTTSVIVDGATDTVVFYDSSTNTHQQITLNNLVSNIIREAYDDVAALGAANELFTGFFTNVPTSDLTITVFFNGVALRAGTTAGWTRSGNDLALVDAVNGYVTESGDIISASYRY